MVLSLFKKYQPQVILALILITLFLTTRLISLTVIPIFVDEAIYLRWAQIAKNDSNWRFISLTDGKQPLFVWATMVMMRFIRDPITAGRLVSTFVGLVSMITIWGLTYLLFKNRKIAFLASLIYLISPFALVYDRMALMDSMVGLFSLLSLFLAIILVKTLRLDVALILGAALGGGILTKTSGFLSIYLLPSTLLLFDWSAKKRWSRLWHWLFLVFLAVLISQLFYSVLRLSPFFYIINQKNMLFVFPFKEWIKHPLINLKSNFLGLSDWLISYITWPLVVLTIFCLASFYRQIKEKLLLFGWFLIPFGGLVLFGNILYPRFIFFMSLPLFILSAWSLDNISCWFNRKAVWLGIVLLFLIPSILIDFRLLFNPKTAPIAKSDRGQYILSWPVGYGVKEIITYARRQAENQKIFIASEGTFGMFPAALELYLWDNPNIEVKGYFPVKEIPTEVLEKAKTKLTFFVFNETVNVPGSFPLKLIAEYPRPDPNYSMRLYQVVVNPNEK